MTRTRIAFESNTLRCVGEIAAEFVQSRESKPLHPCVSEVSGPVRGRRTLTNRVGPLGAWEEAGQECALEPIRNPLDDRRPTAPRPADGGGTHQPIGNIELNAKPFTSRKPTMSLVSRVEMCRTVMLLPFGLTLAT